MVVLQNLGLSWCVNEFSMVFWVICCVHQLLYCCCRCCYDTLFCRFLRSCWCTGIYHPVLFLGWFNFGAEDYWLIVVWSCIAFGGHGYLLFVLLPFLRFVHSAFIKKNKRNGTNTSTWSQFKNIFIKSKILIYIYYLKK